MPSRQPTEADRIHEVLQQAVAAKQSQLHENQIVARIGEYQGCPFLKLDKANWHNRGEVPIPGQVFFSIWMDDHRLNYNIHALKLRHLSNYTLQSRKFADQFRTRFMSTSHEWPNVATNFGPLTLMQGWIENENQIDALINNFLSIHHIIDELLNENRKPC